MQWNYRIDKMIITPLLLRFISILSKRINQCYRTVCVSWMGAFTQHVMEGYNVDKIKDSGSGSRGNEVKHILHVFAKFFFFGGGGGGFWGWGFITYRFKANALSRRNTYDVIYLFSSKWSYIGSSRDLSIFYSLKKTTFIPHSPIVKKTTFIPHSPIVKKTNNKASSFPYNFGLVTKVFSDFYLLFDI